MSKGKSDFGFILKLVLGIAVGIGIGSVASTSAMQVIGSIKYICGQLIFFAVPLVIVGFVAPAITKLGQNASKMLSAAISIAYISSVGAAFFAMAAGYMIIPHLSIPTEVAGLQELPALVFKLNIPPIMPVMTALITALMLGITTLWTGAKTIENILNEFEGIMLMVVQKFILPILPIFIAATFAELTFEGSITKQAPVFLMVILLALVGHLIWLTVLYTIAAIISKRNPMEVIKHYGPAYLTAVGTMSSAATLPVALSCIHKSTVVRRDTADFAVPLGATIHLCGSVLTETLFVMLISLLLYGTLPAVGTMVVFIFLLGIFAVGAPGVPGGTVMASLGIVTAILGFDEAGVALLLAIFALQDSFGTACNVTGDGAIALMIDGIFNPEGKDLQKPA